ncbi:ATP-binding domain-containing protein [Pseudonocardia benzenivorans]
MLAPAARVDALRAALAPGTADAAADDPEAADLDAPVVVLTITAAKGLEFDAVLLVEPAEVLAESPRGANDVYVALTRATQRLTVVHTGELPRMLKRLRPR